MLSLIFAVNSPLIMHEFVLSFLIVSNEEIALRLSSASLWKLLYVLTLMNYILNCIITFLEQSEFLAHESHHYHFIIILFLYDIM